MITVLMAAYNGERYIRQQLDSILAQTVPLRIVVSDDGSRDGTREILAEYQRRHPERIVLRHREEGSVQTGENAQAGDESGDALLRDEAVPAGDGRKSRRMPPAAANFFWLMKLAAEEGISDYVMLSDQDDVWMPDKAEVLLRRMKQLERRLGTDHPVLVHSDMEVADQDLRRIHPSFFSYAHCDPNRVFFSEILAENPVTGGAMMMNRALLFLAARPPEYCCMHDWWIALAASCFGTIDCVRRPLYQYRQHENNVVGATATGSVEDLKKRLGRQQEVRENYRNMMRQAAAFGRHFQGRLSQEQKDILTAFLRLFRQSPPARWKNIRRNHFEKSSRLQTLAMCFTIPRFKRKPGAKGENS